MTERDLTLKVLFPNRFLKAEDIGDRRPNVVIASAQIEQVQMSGGKRERAVLFDLTRPTGEKIDKRLIVNRTNGYAVALLLCADLKARDLREAMGKRITLCADIDTLGKVEVPCIRIAGSPDATPERAAAYASAWRGQRRGGLLVSRIKRTIGLLAMGEAPPVEEDGGGEAEADSGGPVGDLFGEGA